VTRPRIATIVAAAAALVAILLAVPARYEVDGLSMAPGLLPGDIVTSGPWPLADRFRAPMRFERWIVAPSVASLAVKRVAGLPGERVAIRGGDLAVAGRPVLKSPRELAEMTTPLEVPEGAATADGVRLPAAEVLDDAAFAREVNRPLWPVRDRGLAVIVRGGTGASVGCAEIAGTRITWRLAAVVRTAVVAGLLDGHVVAVAWRLPAAAGVAHEGVPPHAPTSWSLAAPWADESATDRAPAVAFTVSAGHGAVIDHVAAWRDVLYRPAADGRDQWRLGAGEYLVLGDFPTGSVDSREWGSLGRDRFRHPVRSSAATAR
jgi:type IV secretory pathway protease TraF